MGTYGPKATSAPTGAIILHPGDNISALVSAAPTGATFYFEPGVYRGVSLAPKDGQTFIGAEGAILSGSAVLTNWTQSGNLWVIGGQTQQGRVHPNAEYEPGTQRPGYPETVFLDNTPLKPVDALSKVVPGTFYFDYAADKIYIADSPTGHTIEAGKLTDAFHGSAANVTVQNLVIEKYDPQIQDGAITGDRGWTVQDNEIRLIYAAGISVHDGSRVVGNYVHDNGQLGVGGSGNNVLVQGNQLANNGFWSHIDPLWEAGGFKFSDSDNLVVRGNYVHDNKGSGLWTDTNNIHTLYEDNVVVHNTIQGISHEISYDAIIRNNTLFGNGFGDTRGWLWGSEINIQDSQNVEVYGNRVEMTGGGNGIILIQSNRGTGTFGPYQTTGNQIHDNTVVDHDGHGIIGGDADFNLSGMLNGGNTWTNNHYFMSDMSDADGGGRFEWGGSKSPSGDFRPDCRVF
jgi:parallel beta-helix repeat protein